MNSAYLASVIAAYGASEETMLSIRDIFMQGDIRYSDPEHEAIVAGFIDNDAVSVSKTHISKTHATHRELPLSDIKGPQKRAKALARAVLQERGYERLVFERAFGGNIPDILAEGRETIAVECGPCSFRKAVDYLDYGAVLWIIKPASTGYDLHEIRRSTNWEKFIMFHKKRSMEEAIHAIDSAFKPV